MHWSFLALAGQSALTLPSALPAPPQPEPIDILELPLPPVAPSNITGACSASINPHNTCLLYTSDAADEMD